MPKLFQQFRCNNLKLLSSLCLILPSLKIQVAPSLQEARESKSLFTKRLIPFKNQRLLNRQFLRILKRISTITNTRHFTSSKVSGVMLRKKLWQSHKFQKVKLKIYINSSNPMTFSKKVTINHIRDLSKNMKNKRR